MENKFTSTNGIDIYSYLSPHIGAFSISLYLRYGLLYEGKDENGFAHFFEHSIFRNISTLLDGKLYETLDRSGLYFNAHTYTDYIEFFITGAPKHFKTAAEIICLTLSPIVMKRRELDTERRRIKAEILEDDDEDSLNFFADGIVYGGTPLARTICGRPADIDRYGINRLKSKRGEILTRENMFFYIGGNFPENAPRMLSDIVSGYMVYSGKRRENSVPIPSGFCRRDCAVAVKNASSASVSISFDIPHEGFTIPEVYLLDDILFSGQNNPMYMELSEKNGLIYGFTTGTVCYGNLSVLNMTYEIQHGKLLKSIELVLGVFASVKKLTEYYLPLVKTKYTENLYTLLDDAGDISSSFGYTNHILGLGFSTLEERQSAFASVNAQRISRLAEKTIKSDNLVIAVKGNEKKIDVSEIKNLARKILDAPSNA